MPLLDDARAVTCDEEQYDDNVIDQFNIPQHIAGETELQQDSEQKKTLKNLPIR